MSGVDAVVVERRTPQDLDRFVDSYRRTCGPEDRLLVVRVDPDPDGYQPPAGVDPANVIFECVNVGYNVACEHALARFGELQPVVALFNADVVLEPGALEQCAAALLAEPTWGVLGPRQVDDGGRITAGGIVGPRDRPMHRFWKQADRGQASDIVIDCPTVAGSALFARREVLAELAACPHGPGTFLGPMFHYWGETWACYHAIEHGWRCVFYGPIRIVHQCHSASVVGGKGEQHAPADRSLFRRLCANHNIPCD